MFVTTFVASTLGKIFQPFFDAMAWLIAGFYSVVPNYALAIALLTIVVMAVTAPLTIKSTRSMMAMSRLQPQMKELQKKYKQDKVRLNEEMMKLYRENSVSPAAGCVPMLLQFPIFIVLYDTIRGLTNTNTVHGHLVARPDYVGHRTAIYQSLIAHPGHMNAFGINLADTVFSHLSWPGRIPYIAMIAVAIGLQYFQMHQMNKRNSASQINQQMQAMQKFMPLIFAVIYVRIAAGVNVYFIVSSACRIGLQMWSFRAQPAVEEARVGRLGAPAGGGKQRKTLMERLGEAQQRALEQQAQQRAAGATPGLVKGQKGAGSRDAAAGTDMAKPGGQRRDGLARSDAPRSGGPAKAGVKTASGGPGKRRPPTDVGAGPRPAAAAGGNGSAGQSGRARPDGGPQKNGRPEASRREGSAGAGRRPPASTDGSSSSGRTSNQPKPPSRGPGRPDRGQGPPAGGAGEIRKAR